MAFQQFRNHRHNKMLGKYNLHADTYKYFLSAQAPNLATNTVKGDITEIAVGGGYTGPVDIENTVEQVGDEEFMRTADDKLLSASGNVAGFRYIYIYNDDKDDDLAYVADIGFTVNLTAGLGFRLDFGAYLDKLSDA